MDQQQPKAEWKDQITGLWDGLTQKIRACKTQEEMSAFFSQMKTQYVKKLQEILKPDTFDLFDEIATEQYKNLKKGMQEAASSLDDEQSSNGKKKSTCQKIISVLVYVANLGRFWLEMATSEDPEVQKMAFRLLELTGEIIKIGLKALVKVLEVSLGLILEILKELGHVLVYVIRQIWYGVSWLGDQLVQFVKWVYPKVKEVISACFKAIKWLFEQIWNLFNKFILPPIISLFKVMSDYPGTSLCVGLLVGVGAAYYLQDRNEYA